MKIWLELFLLMGILFPIYHILNVILNLNKNKGQVKNTTRPITILIPCFNEAKMIKNTIEGLARIEYENYECIFINDGSTDDTLKRLYRILKLKKIKRQPINDIKVGKVFQVYQSKRFPYMFVIDKDNGGKSDALNVGINYALHDYVVTLDADSILKKDALALVSGAFDDEDVVAASGVIQILQSFKLNQREDKTSLKINYLLKLQALEYLKSCYCYKASLAKLDSLLVISGAFGIFKKEILLAVNGFTNVIGEDLDLTLKIQFYIQNSHKKIAYIPEAICYTEGPETLKDYFKQRKRWQQSFLESLINYRKILFKTAFTRSLSFFMIIDALFLGVISSFIILFFSGILINNVISGTLTYIYIYLIIFVLVHLLYNIVGILIGYYYGVRYKGMDIMRIIFTIILDIVVYRIIILLTIITGTISYFRGNKGWNKVKRSGRNYHVLKKGGSYG
ncbi:MAG: glycosyltransferase family 2 protein [Bacilli bacterium]|nr:glycosyltransferase family 2 protein [Bacilli bacterium]MDD4808542.1 glycosyltransferase family 2 protein [Bacilli bacterium]